MGGGGGACRVRPFLNPPMHNPVKQYIQKSVLPANIYFTGIYSELSIIKHYFMRFETYSNIH